jgi:type IV pilus assembly protein PilC
MNRSSKSKGYIVVHGKHSRHTRYEQLWRMGDILKFEIGGSPRKLPYKQRQILFNDLQMLLMAGLDLRASFEIMIASRKRNKEQHLLKMVFEYVVSGDSLAMAMERTNRFDNYDCYSILIGEETGRLAPILSNLSLYYQKRIDQRRKIISAFSYPMIVVLTAILAIAFMMNFVVPMFAEVFTRFGQDLPAMTKRIIVMSEGAVKLFPAIMIFVFAAFITARVFKKEEWYQRYISQIQIMLPFIGQLIRQIHLTRFFIAMELLTGANTPLVKALQLVKEMIAFYPLKRAVSDIESGIISGNSLHDSMEKHSIFDLRVCALVKVAEETNQLEVVFGKLKDQFNKEIEHRTAMMTAVMEPLIILVIGAFVAFILVAMYMPMFQLNSSLGG